jgi:hypothetical protein
MVLINEPIESTQREESRSVDATKCQELTAEEVLLWEAT